MGADVKSSALYGRNYGILCLVLRNLQDPLAEFQNICNLLSGNKQLLHCSGYIQSVTLM